MENNLSENLQQNYGQRNFFGNKEKFNWKLWPHIDAYLSQKFNKFTPKNIN